MVPARATQTVSGDSGVVVITFGPVFDCSGDDASVFVGPEGTTPVTAAVGTPVEWVYDDWLHPVCTARLTSTSVPSDGEAFDSGVVSPGERFRFVPGVAGTWGYADVFNGGTGTLHVVAPTNDATTVDLAVSP